MRYVELAVVCLLVMVVVWGVNALGTAVFPAHRAFFQESFLWYQTYGIGLFIGGAFFGHIVHGKRDA